MRPTTNHGTITGFSPVEEFEVIKAVLIMFDGCQTYSKPWSANRGRAWLEALRSSPDVELAEFLSAASWWLGNQADFPAPAQIFEWVRSQRKKATPSAIPVAEDIEAKAAQDAKNFERYGTTTPTIAQIQAMRPKAVLTVQEGDRPPMIPKAKACRPDADRDRQNELRKVQSECDERDREWRRQFEAQSEFEVRQA